MARRTSLPASPYVNCRDIAQRSAWKTYFESQESTAAAAADANESIVDVERETEGAAPKPGKRRRESGSPEEIRVVKRQVGPHDRRLTQTYAGTPSDAIPISVPTRKNEVHDDDWNPVHDSEMGVPKRPAPYVNTLDHGTSQSGNKNFFSGVANGKSPALRTASVAGGNVRNVNQAFEDYQATERSTKKPRLNSNARPSRQSPMQAVDLTDDKSEDHFGGIPRPKWGGMASRKTTADDPFAMDESKQAGSFTKQKPSRSEKRRSNTDARSASQRSSYQGSPPNDVPDRCADNMTGMRSSPIVIEESQDGRTKMRMTNQRIPIELDKGLSDIQTNANKAKTKAVRGSDQDLQVANSLFSTVRPTNKAPALPARRLQKEEPSRLRDTFKRAGSSPVRPKAKDRMRADSRDRSSPDQLQGSTTILSHSSPNKGSPRLPPRSAKSGGMQQQRPSNVGVESALSDDTDEPEPNRIPINMICSKQCVEEQENLALVWDDESNQFFVARGKEKVRLPNRAALVTIGKSDAIYSWIQEKNGGRRVCLKGSMTDVSNGNIMIEFKDKAGLSECYADLMHLTDNNMKTSTATTEYMEKHFANQKEALTDAHARLRNTPVVSAVSMSKGRRAGWQAIDDSEHIRYDDEPIPSAAAKQKQYSRGMDERSPFFPEESRRSTRTKPAAVKPRSPTPPPRWSHQHEPVVWQQPVVYPSLGARRVTVYDSDISRLDEGEFLNDNLLGFAIRHIEENMAPVHKQKVHFFNTFFFSALMKNTRIMDYHAVKRWTKNIDIFTVPYTVVPINNNLHWYIAIICNLQHLERKLDDDGDDQPRESVKDANQSIIDIDADDDAVEDVQVDSSNQAVRTVDGSDDNIFVFNDNGRIEDTATSSHASTATSNKQKKPKRKSAQPTRKYGTDIPAIIMLDSLDFSRTGESTALKKYIAAEAKEKRAMDVDFKQIQGINAKGIPQQPNYFDCGVYVVGYLTEFAKDPDKFVKKLLHREMDPEEDFKGFNASKVREHIRNSLFDVHDQQEEERRLYKAQKRKAKQTGTPATTSKQASPVPPAQEQSTATMRSSPTPAQRTANLSRSSPIRTSQTAPLQTNQSGQPNFRSKDDEADEDELEVCAPTTLKRAGHTSSAPVSRAPSSSSESDDSDDTDEEMLDVKPESTAGATALLLPNLYSQDTASLAEIADSQGMGY